MGVLDLGLTNSSVGAALTKKSDVSQADYVIALAGNPNVGKSTVFNALTGLRQHTGNWTGKTVSNAEGNYDYGGKTYTLVDVPGTYSLFASSAEEEVARDFICFGNADAAVIVLDATCLERNLNLAIQVCEAVPNVAVCVNLLDEAEKKGIEIDLDELSLRLGTEVAGVAARSGRGLDGLMKCIETVCKSKKRPFRAKVSYPEHIEIAVSKLEKAVSEVTEKLDSRWLALKLLEYDESLKNAVNEYLGFELWEEPSVKKALSEAWAYLKNNGYDQSGIHDEIVSSIVKKAEETALKCVSFTKKNYDKRDRNLDRIFTSRATGIPIMLLMLGVIFWITIVGANYPSQLLSALFQKLQNWLSGLLLSTSLPTWIEGVVVQGMVKTLAWVVSVMLPPMAIFFPLFTILEDLGYLPRVAFNLDKFFRKSGAHGKQSLTMCLGKVQAEFQVDRVCAM